MQLYMWATNVIFKILVAIFKKGKIGKSNLGVYVM